MPSELVASGTVSSHLYALHCLFGTRSLVTNLPGEHIKHCLAGAKMARFESMVEQRRAAAISGRSGRRSGTAYIDSLPKGGANWKDPRECARQVVQMFQAHQREKVEAYLDHLAAQSAEFKGTKFHHTLIKACADARCPQIAGQFFKRMVAMGMVPSIVTFNTLLNACAEVGNIQLGEEWWATMLRFGVEPNVISYNILIKACARGRDAERAEMWLSKMLNGGCKPSCITFGTVIDACAKVGDLAKAAKWAIQMRCFGFTLDTVMYNSVLDACAKAGNPDEAERWYEEMLSKACVPNEKAYNSLIHACAKAGDFEKAEWWFDCMLESGCRADLVTYSSMIYVAAKLRDLAKAEYWMMEVHRQGFKPNVIVWNTLLHACARVGDSSKAVFWMRQMQRTGTKPTIVTFNCLIEASVSSGNQAETVFWLKQMVEAGFDPDEITLTTLEQAACKEGSCHRNSSFPPRWACIALIETCGKLGKTKNMMHWCEVAAQGGYLLPPELQRAVAHVGPRVGCSQGLPGDHEGYARQCSHAAVVAAGAKSLPPSHVLSGLVGTGSLACKATPPSVTSEEDLSTCEASAASCSDGHSEPLDQETQDTDEGFHNTLRSALGEDFVIHQLLSL